MPKVLEKLSPFNKFFYRSCIYNSFFAIMEYYEINLLYIIGYVDGYYRLSKENQLELEYIDDIESSYKTEMLIELACKARIDALVHEKGSDLLFIKNEISYLHPVIAIVDCYYLPYRIDVYKKKHLFHPVLIKGYDEQCEKYFIIDQINDESLTYSNHIIDYNDFEQALEAYNACNADNDLSCLSSYSYNNDSNVDISTIKENAIDIKKTYRHRFSQGLFAVKTYKDNLNVKDLADNIESVVQQLSDIINFKLVEKHKLELLFVPQNKELNEINNGITSCWKTFRRDLYMFSYSNRMDVTTLYNKLTSLLHDIYVYEKKYHDLFLQL